MKMRKLWAREQRWLTLLMILGSFAACCMVFFFGNYVSNELKSLYFQSGGSFTENIFSTYMNTSQMWYLIVVVGVILISYVLFWDIRQGRAREWLGVLPVKKETVFYYQWFRGMLTYTIPIVIYAFGVCLIRARNISWIREIYAVDINWKVFITTESTLMYIKVAFWVWLWATVCYSIAFFMQSMSKSGVMAMLVTIGMISTTTYLLGLMNYLNAIGMINSDAYDTWFESHTWFLFIFKNTGVLQYSDFISTSIFNIHAFDLVFALFIIALMFFLALYYFKKENQGLEDEMFTAKWLRYVIFTGFAFCLSAGIFTNIAYHKEMHSKVLLIAEIIIATFAFVAVTDRQLKRRGY